jgi:hypothetical protein
MLKKTDAESIAHEWLDAWNAHDIEAILKHYSTGIIFHSPFVQRITGNADGIVQGKGELRTYFSKALVAYPALRFELFEILAGVNSFVIYYKSINNLLAAETFILNEQLEIKEVFAHYK